MKQLFLNFLCRPKSPQDDAMEKLCEAAIAELSVAEAERKALFIKHMFETRDQFKKDLKQQLDAKTNLCVGLYCKTGM